MMSLIKNPQPPTKKFFSSADQKTGQFIWALEQLSNAISGGAMALVRQLTTADFRFQSTNISYRFQSTNILYPSSAIQILEADISIFVLFCEALKQSQQVTPCKKSFLSNVSDKAP